MPHCRKEHYHEFTVLVYIQSVPVLGNRDGHCDRTQLYLPKGPVPSASSLAWLPVSGGGKSTFLWLEFITATTNPFGVFPLRGIGLSATFPDSDAWLQCHLLPSAWLLQEQNVSLGLPLEVWLLHSDHIPLPVDSPFPIVYPCGLSTEIDCQDQNF